MIIRLNLNNADLPGTADIQMIVPELGCVKID